MDQTTPSAPVDGLHRAGQDAVALPTTDRRARLDALDTAPTTALQVAPDAVERDPGAQAVIPIGAGDRAFSAGADIRAVAPTTEGGEAMRSFVRPGQALAARREAFPKPTICAVDGLAYSAGWEGLEIAPLAVAAERALFAQPEIRLGFLPAFGGTERLARSSAGRPIPAEEARAIGLADRVVPLAGLIDAAMAMTEGAIRAGLDGACEAAPMPRGSVRPVPQGHRHWPLRRAARGTDAVPALLGEGHAGRRHCHVVCWQDEIGRKTELA